MTDLQQRVIAACEEKACSAAELVDAFGVSRWYVYQLAKRGFLKNISNDHSAAQYVAVENPKKETKHTPRVQRKWKPQAALQQAPSIWHYAERLK